MRAWLLALLLASTVLAGCASNDSNTEEPDYDDVVTNVTRGNTTTLAEREIIPFNTTLNWSQTLIEGTFDILPAMSVFVEVPLPVTEGGSAVLPTETVLAHLGLFMPDIPGCDWSASELPEECQVPIIGDAGPYYTESDVDADQRNSGRLGEFMISNFVPHGYGVAQISVLGSGKSTHCFDMFGLAEQLGVHHAVEWLGSQPFSNGNVGLMGRSYDGSTPWMAAAHASEGSALKTIVPISGLTGLQDLVTWNGASEARILLFHNVVYGTFGVSPGDQLPNQLLRRATCPDWVTGTPWGVAGYASGDSVVDLEGTYWQERNFLDRAIQNYRGSVYMIHGLKDDNVDPHAGWPGHLLFEQAGLDTKGMYGQWFHSYPDRPSEHGAAEPQNSVRYDWAQDLLEWFDYYLKEEGEQPDLHVEVQLTDGRWRVDDAVQPSNSEILDITIPAGQYIVDPGALGFSLQPDEVSLGVVDADNETILGGLSSVTLSVIPTAVGGQVYVELYDATAGNTFGLSYGVMELRQTGQTVAPGVEMDVEIPLQYFAGALPAGNQLGLRIIHAGNDFLPSVVAAPLVVTGGTVHLSTVQPSADAWFEPPVWFEEEAEDA